jgi:hypothetical protein
MSRSQTGACLGHRQAHVSVTGRRMSRSQTDTCLSNKVREKQQKNCCASSSKQTCTIQRRDTASSTSLRNVTIADSTVQARQHVTSTASHQGTHGSLLTKRRASIRLSTSMFVDLIHFRRGFVPRTCTDTDTDTHNESVCTCIDPRV